MVGTRQPDREIPPGGGPVIEPIRSPWEDFEEGEVFGADALYAGPHEVIEDLILLYNVVLEFESIADDLRYWDRLGSGNAQEWEQNSVFAELTSINMSNEGVKD